MNNAIRLAAFCVVLVAVTALPAWAQTPPSVVDAQWFTGPLVAPSSAPATAGILEIEPYAIFTGNTGAYGDNGSHQSVSHDPRTAQSEVVLQYSVTDRLTIEAVPSGANAWASQTSFREIGPGDLPVILKYRAIDGNPITGAPSVTGFLGMSLPTGAYENLTASSLALGSGAYTMREGVLLQSLFEAGGRALRLRLYADAFEPLSSPSLSGINAYTALQGFHGRATPGVSADGGLGIEYGLTQRWVLALDLVENCSNADSVTGAIGNAAIATTKGVSSSEFSVAPAIEYNFNANVGIIAGVQFSVFGRNASSYIAPQIALNMAF
jgi:hypothetical protein